MQHWMYTASYFDLALVFRYYFRSSLNDEVIDARKKREQRLTTINGFVYFALLAGLFIEVFFNGYSIQ